MIEAVLVTILPAGFLIMLFGGGALFVHKRIGQDGVAPVDRTVFYASKYSILILWGAMALANFRIGISLVNVPRILQVIALPFWFAGFALLYAGRVNSGDSFRLGIPREDSRLTTAGLFRLSRNPMYVGVYATIAAASLSTLNPLVVLLGAFVIAVHHRIVLTEEKHLQDVFCREYSEYCGRVPRYIPLQL